MIPLVYFGPVRTAVHATALVCTLLGPAHLSAQAAPPRQAVILL
ncbi:MAG: hypothetical protein RI891_963, partial [Gemmatimonadota bacterium]